MTEPIKPIKPVETPGGMYDALIAVRLARVSAANRTSAKQELASTAMFCLIGTAVWWTGVLATWLLFGAAHGEAVGDLVGSGMIMTILAGAYSFLSIPFPGILSMKPAIGNTSFESEQHGTLYYLAWLAVTMATFPGIGVLYLFATIATMRHDPLIRIDATSSHPRRRRASAILGDVRVRKLYDDLARQVDDWKQAIIPVNRLIHLANAGMAELSGKELALIAHFHARQNELERLVTLAEALLEEGPLGTRRAGDTEDAEDPLSRLQDRVPLMRERTASLAEDGKRLVAAREVDAMTGGST